MKSKKIPSGIAIVVIILIIIIVANLASVFVVTSVQSFSSSLPAFEKKIFDLFSSLIISLNISKEEIDSLNSSLKLTNVIESGNLTAFLGNFFKGVLGIFGNFLLIIFYVILILSEMGNIKGRIIKAFPKEKAEGIVKTTENIFLDLRTYVFGKTIISLLLGILSGLTLKIFGVEYYFTCGFLIFIMHFIPNIGAFIALTLPVLIMILQFDNIITPIIVFSILVIMQNIVGNIIEPVIFGGKLKLSPLLLLFSLFIGGYVWGIVGMVFSVPITNMIKIILMNFESTKPVAILMSYNFIFSGKNLPENA